MKIREIMDIVEGRFTNAVKPAEPTPTMSPKSQGWEAARAGEEASANPHPKGSPEAHQWDVGYQDHFFND